MLVLAIPVVVFNAMFAHLAGYDLPEDGLVQWISPILGTVLYFWGGWPFLTGAVSETRSRKPGLMMLIGLAITVAFVSSWGSSWCAGRPVGLLVGAGAAGRGHALGPQIGRASCRERVGQWVWYRG